MTKNVLAPENLGAEFDVGVEEEDMVHVRTGRGLWRNGDVLESIPHGSGERWALRALGASFGVNWKTSNPQSWDATNPTFADITTVASGAIVTYKNVGNSGVDWTFQDENSPGSTWRPGNPGINASTGLFIQVTNNTLRSGMLVTFSKPIIFTTTARHYSHTNGQPLGVVGESSLESPDAAWTSSIASDAGQGSNKLTLFGAFGGLRTVSSVNPITSMVMHCERNAQSTSLALEVTTIQAVDNDLYTVQRYADGRLLAVSDSEPALIQEDLTGLSVLDHAPLHNYAASAVPSVADDGSAGYSRGSRWNDGTDEYVCVDATAGAAVWKVAT